MRTVVSSILQVPALMLPFDPLFRNPHVQTIAGHFWKRPRTLPQYPMERRFIRTEPDVKGRVCSEQPTGERRGEDGAELAGSAQGSGERGRSGGGEGRRGDRRGTRGALERLALPPVQLGCICEPACSVAVDAGP